MNEHDNDLLNLVAKTLAYDEEQSVEKEDVEITFERDEHGVLWGYDANGEKVGRIYEHGDDDADEDEIEEV